jgi:hypothetical protein
MSGSLETLFVPLSVKDPPTCRPHHHNVNHGNETT